MNLYAYAKNNPYRYSDPNGLFAIALFFVPSLVEVSFTGVVTLISAKVVAEAFIGSLIATGLGIGVYQLNKALNYNKNYIAINNEAVVEDVEKEKRKKKPGIRTEPIDLEEKLALDEAKNNPGEKIKREWNDPCYPSSEWEKKSHSHDHQNGTKTEIHWWENVNTGEKHGYKFKDLPDNVRSRIYKL